MTSSQSLDGYMMDLDSGTGDITINGNDYDDEYEVNGEDVGDGQA